MTQSSEIVKSELIAAAQFFQKGDRVSHRNNLTIVGEVTQGPDFRLPMPQIWVVWDNWEGFEVNPPLPYSPFDLVRAESLSVAEAEYRDCLETQIRQAFYVAGKALKELRDKRLYRDRYTSFEDYCNDVFDLTRRNVNYLIAGSAVVENLKMGTIGSQILPTAERQVRPLSQLAPNEQSLVWQEAVERSDGKVPSGKAVKEVVQERSDQQAKNTTAPQPTRSFLKPGDAVLVKCPRGSLAEVKKWNGCWALIEDVGELGSLGIVAGDGVKMRFKPNEVEIIDNPTPEFVSVAERVVRLLKRDDLQPVERQMIVVYLRSQTFTPVQLQFLDYIDKYYQTESST